MTVQLDFSILARDPYPQTILAGVETMLELTALAFVLAAAVAVITAVARMGSSRIAKALFTAFVEYHQNTPLLIQIFIWYFGIPALLPDEAQRWFNAHNAEFLFAMIAIGLCLGAYMSEDLRAGIRSIPRAQLEASRALGLSYLQATRLVVLPQAIRVAMPTLVSHTVLLFKNTSLAMTVGVAELTYATKEIESQSFRTVEVYVFSTIAYLAISLLIMGAGSLIEGRLRLKAR